MKNKVGFISMIVLTGVIQNSFADTSKPVKCYLEDQIHTLVFGEGKNQKEARKDTFKNCKDLEALEGFTSRCDDLDFADTYSCNDLGQAYRYKMSGDQTCRVGGSHGETPHISNIVTAKGKTTAIAVLNLYESCGNLTAIDYDPYLRQAIINGLYMCK